MLSIYRSGEIDLLENLDTAHIRLLVEPAEPHSGLCRDFLHGFKGRPVVLWWCFGALY
jgi:hypothetical protein